MMQQASGAGKKEQVRKMFDDIAARYDFLNHFLSLGIDHSWRKKVVRRARAMKPALILDLATGTGDLAIALAACRPEHITGLDLSEEMLRIGIEKVRKKGLDQLISMQQGEAEALPFSDNSFDLATAAFGVRNFENLEKGLSEMCRVLKPGGQVMILEFSTVESGPWKVLFSVYFRFILPVVGRLVSRHSSAYTYLPESVEQFPSGEAFLSILRGCGFENTDRQKLSGGVASLYTGFKPA